MANYYEDGRTNYFKVKDSKKFLDEVGEYDVEVITRKDEKTGDILYGLMTQSEEGWPYWQIDDDGNEFEVHLFENGIVEDNLEDGWVCIYMGIGKEKMRYLTGYAVAFNNNGEVEIVNLNIIYDKAKRLGNKIELAEY